MRVCFVIFVALFCKSIADELPDAKYHRSVHQTNKHENKCYDDKGKAQKCLPPYENIAFNVRMEATSTCGEDGTPTEYCMQTNEGKVSCATCKKGDHDAIFLTDNDNKDNLTWWQSQMLKENVKDFEKVRLTLALGRTYEITNVRLQFVSPRPQSMAIFRKKRNQFNWMPYQVYSTSCYNTYNIEEAKLTQEGGVYCTSEYSDIHPVTNGTVSFFTLEHRPSANYFESSSVLQELVQAAELMFSLDKPNTNLNFTDMDQLKKSKFYAISDISVGGRCACNGHASECVDSTSADGTVKKVCLCEHNTAGPECNECLPFYNEVPWAPATSNDAHECQRCNCNGYSEKCVNVRKNVLHVGGQCVDCAGNRAGYNCERCKENHYQSQYQRPGQDYCIPCKCNEIGSHELRCNNEGKCQCKKGVTGDKCDRCIATFYDFGQNGCKSCECNVAGSLYNTPSCDPDTGNCLCKKNVEGKNCEVCKPGFFNLALGNEFGCLPCFCHGHSSICKSNSDYAKFIIESTFKEGIENWTATIGDKNLPIQYDNVSLSVFVTVPESDNVYFNAPEKFLGDQRFAYNQFLTFELKIGQTEPTSTDLDVILEGANGQQITQTILGQHNKEPNTAIQEYRFKLNENEKYEWQPELSSKDFISILANLTAIKIRAPTQQGQGYLNYMKLETAKRGAIEEPADWVEHCNCPKGYTGQFCESCARKFHRDPPNGGPSDRCVSK